MTAGPFGLPVTVAGVTMNTGVADADGIEWYLEAVDGWDGPAVRLPVDDRAFADGAFIADGYYGARSLTVKGTALSPTPQAGLVVARTTLARVTNLLRADGTVQVLENPDKQVTVRLAGPPRMVDDPPVVRFEVPLIAADPRKFAVAVSSSSVGLASTSGGMSFNATPNFTFGTVGTGGQLVLTNAGTVDTPCRYTIAGPVDNPAIQHIGLSLTLTFGISLLTGDLLVVDTRDRTVVLNGTASRRGTLAAGSQWFDLQPGANTVRFLAPSYVAAATLTADFRSAWL